MHSWSLGTCFPISVSCLSNVLFPISRLVPFYVLHVSRFRSPAFLCARFQFSTFPYAFPDFGLLLPPFQRAFPFRSPAAFLGAPDFNSLPFHMLFPISVSARLPFYLLLSTFPNINMMEYVMLLMYYLKQYQYLPNQLKFLEMMLIMID